MLDRSADRTLRHVRRGSAGRLIARSTDQLHDRLAAEAVSDRDNSTSDRSPRLAVKINRAPLRQDSVQTYGVSHFEQNGRRIGLMPGDCLAYDVSCPHTIISPSLTRHDVVIVPAELLQERGFHSAKLPACKISARTGTGRIAHDFMHAAFGEAPKLSPQTAHGVADTLIDLLLLPLREAGTAFDRGGPVALYERAQPSSTIICAIPISASSKFRRRWAAPSATCTCCSAKRE